MNTTRRTIRPSRWPVLRRYDGERLARIALPLGGIGTGTVSLGGRGNLRDWEIMNRPAKGFVPRLYPLGPGPFFALRARVAGQTPSVRALEGPIPVDEIEGYAGARSPQAGLPRFRHCEFRAAYPLGQVLLADPDFPLRVRLEAFNPLIPGDADQSGLPLAVLRYVLTNRTGQNVSTTVCGNLPNLIGLNSAALLQSGDGTIYHAGAKANRNEVRQETGLRGVFMTSRGVDRQSEFWGTLALITPHTAGVSYRTSWASRRDGNPLLDFWDDLMADGKLEDRPQDEKVDVPMASLAVSVGLRPHQTRAVTFLLTWHFPNRLSWKPPLRSAPAVTPGSPAAAPGAPADPGPGGCSTADCKSPGWVGNYYATRYADAWDVAVRVAPQLKSLEQKTVQFVSAFCRSTLPGPVQEAALFNLSTLRSQTCFRTADGRFFGWEGCGDTVGCCKGSCTHVWNYEHATGFLFGALSRSMREVEFLHTTTEAGQMTFRVELPLAPAQPPGLAAADGQMGTLLRLYRDWKFCGDENFLRSLWPRARKALEFCWIPGGWDADQDGVMEGCQGNTMDVEYFGPNPQMTGWYLGALRAVEEIARHLGESDFAGRCRELFESGSRWMDEHLFNGEYYEHEIRPPHTARDIAPGLLGQPSRPDLADPIRQLGSGCLVDQLVGQYTAHVCGLGYLHDPRKIRQTFRSIRKYNFKRNFYSHFNDNRAYAVNGESGLVMASYPKGRRPLQPFPYYGEVMTGFEYAAAIGLLYEGMTRLGLQSIAAVRARYDGRKRNPFDEAECGHHYARALASWAAVLALTGFQYSAITQTMEFAAAPKPVTWFWSNGAAWGTFERNRREARLRVLHGKVTLQRLIIRGRHIADWDPARTIRAGDLPLKVRFRT